jgi:hypothetical protein
MDFSSVPSALTVADAERFFAARANIVTRYNACRRKLLVELYRDELDFTTVAIAKLEAGGTCPGEVLDVFWIGNDGAIWTTWWDARLNGAAWNAPFQVSGPNAAAQNSVVSVLARMSEHLDVFWTAPDGSVVSNWWDRWVNREQWNTPFRVWP